MASFDENGKYIKTNWKAGDKITATKLNKIEESIEAVNDNDISRHVEADARLDALEAKDVAHDKEFTNVKNLIKDNKAAAELGDYEINSRMTFLENELNEGIEEVHNVASTVDGKIAAADANMKAQVNKGKADMEAMVAEVEGELEGINSQLTCHNQTNGIYRLKYIYGAKGDGITDDTEALQNALANEKILYLDKGTYLVSDTLNIRNNQAIIGYSPNIRNVDAATVIKYIGSKDPRKTVILMGKNKVGAEPTEDCTNNVLMNVCIDCNNLAGFGVYGTYVTNETLVQRIFISRSLEYGCYFAKGWYARFDDITATYGKNCGMAFGLPLTYLDGTTVEWTTEHALEMNNTRISNVRAHTNGRYFSTDNPGAYDLLTHYNLGYGIGAGSGHSFHLCGFLSEKNGGCGLYVWNHAELCKKIYDGYLENNCLGSLLDKKTESGHIIINSNMDYGEYIWLESIFMPADGGGIYSMGQPREILLRQIYRPSFLKTLNGLNHNDYIFREKVHYDCGYFNQHSNYWDAKLFEESVNTRWNFGEDLLTTGYTLFFIKKHAGSTPVGGINITRSNGEVINKGWSSAVEEKWTFLYGGSGVVSFSKSGASSDNDAYIDLRIVTTKKSF